MKTTLKVIAAILFVAAICFVTFAAYMPAGDAKTPAGPSKTYIVHNGDTLWSIVESHHEYDGKDPRQVIWDIKHLNHMETPDIKPGQAIQLP